MEVYFTEAVMVKAVPYGEADLVCTLLTHSQGRVTALARGAKKSLKRFGGALDYFSVFNAEIRPSRVGMAKLLGVELVQSLGGIAGDLDRMEVASHVLELARLASIEGDHTGELYLLTRQILGELNCGGRMLDLARIFQVKLLIQTGYAIDAGFCTHCGGDIPEAKAGFLGARPVCLPCGGSARRTISPGTFKTLAAIGNLDLQKLSGLRISPLAHDELKPVLMVALSQSLGAQIKNPL